MSAFETCEILQLIIKECFVYKVPPLRTASGHRAEDWNLASPIFTGCIKVFQADVKLVIRIYRFKDPSGLIVKDDNIQLFGECPIEIKPGENVLNFVDGVIDSSRYFVVRIKDPKSDRTTSIGVGFRDRDPAFDFKESLNEYVKYINRMGMAEQMHEQAVSSREGNGDGSDGEDRAPFQPSDQFALKPGEKIAVLPHMTKKINKPATTAGPGGSGGGGGFLGLKPPPPAGSTVTMHVTTPVSVVSSIVTGTTTAAAGGVSDSTAVVTGEGEVDGDDEEWGEFA